MKSSLSIPWRCLVVLTLSLASFTSLGKDIPLHDVIAHDPVMIRQGKIWYVFCTGRGITVYSSSDMKHWQRRPSVFHTAPAWAHRAVQGFHGVIWAPDVVHVSGHYVLYYAISAFGKNTSAIGVATNTTLNSHSPKYHWVDQGIVVRSIPNRDLWNAIDPAVIRGGNGGLWMAFGSFWSGLKMVKLRPDGLRPAQPQRWYTIARRARPPFFPETRPGPAAEEAPFVFKRGGWYYLFMSWDYCCRGVKSTYKIMVGRSRSVHGPYVDASGKPLNRGGGTLVLKGDAHYPGVGSNAVVDDHGIDDLVFHAYDAHDHGLPKLKILPIHWSDKGWPEVSRRKLDQSGH
jgi:arabinan endo-1,5-alpha-L-arabinosidase